MGWAIFPGATELVCAVGLIALTVISYNVDEACCKGASTGDTAPSCKVGDATLETSGLAAEECDGSECLPATLIYRFERVIEPYLEKEGDADTCRLNVCSRLV